MHRRRRPQGLGAEADVGAHGRQGRVLPILVVEVVQVPRDLRALWTRSIPDRRIPVQSIARGPTSTRDLGIGADIQRPADVGHLQETRQRLEAPPRQARGVGVPIGITIDADGDEEGAERRHGPGEVRHRKANASIARGERATRRGHGGDRTGRAPALDTTTRSGPRRADEHTATHAGSRAADAASRRETTRRHTRTRRTFRMTRRRERLNLACRPWTRRRLARWRRSSAYPAVFYRADSAPEWPRRSASDAATAAGHAMARVTRVALGTRRPCGPGSSDAPRGT